jgi:hypothetical protein
MIGKTHNVDEVTRVLNKKRDVKIDSRNKTVYLLDDPKKKSSDIGTRSWGKIDYLTNHAGYARLYVSDYPKF